ncbi:MAG: phage minor head protein, partial [Rhodocyclaceae bacterium]|nr:phage minor head protein [Rhodocyclaceae bacterium]
MRAGFNQPFGEQVAFFRRKLALPSERWDDIERAAHDRGFIVAGAMKTDLVADLQAAVGTAIEQGKSIQWFRQNFDAIVARHGWTGWTGEGSKGGYAWRTRVIYQTNMATSYAAGRWAQLNDPDLVSLRPYWKYRHADGVLHPRPLHLAWNGLVLPRDHPFWKTHFPPNGWGCHCSVSAASAAEYAAAQADGSAEPPAGWDAVSPKTGAPVGIDRGFDYAPGASVDVPLRQMVADKLISYPPAITRALTKDLNRYVEARYSPADFATTVLADRSITDPLWLGFVENPAALKAETGVDALGYPVLLPAETPRHVERVHGFDGGDQRPAVPADYARVLEVLNAADVVRLGEVVEGHQRLIATRQIDGETWRAVYEV